MVILLFPDVLHICDDNLESVNVPDFTLDEFKEIIESLLNFSNISDLDGNNDFDYSNNNSVDCEMDSPEHLISSLTRLTSRLQDNNLPEDDIVVVLLELAELEVTIPALLETGTGVVVRRLEKKSQGMVAKLARELVIKWKGIALKYEPEPPVKDIDDMKTDEYDDEKEEDEEDGSQENDLNDEQLVEDEEMTESGFKTGIEDVWKEGDECVALWDEDGR